MFLKEFMVKVQMFSEAPNSCDIVHFFFSIIQGKLFKRGWYTNIKWILLTLPSLKFISLEKTNWTISMSISLCHKTLVFFVSKKVNLSTMFDYNKIKFLLFSGWKKKTV